jgi:hypothetical protein
MRNLPHAAIASQHENLSPSSAAIHYDRREEHASDALLLLQKLRQAARDGVYPSTADLQAEGTYGLRPVNRLVDLRHGKYNRTRYDIERMDCGHGVFRWRLHEPNRPGYPKDKRQSVLPLSSSGDWHERQMGHRRPVEQQQADDLRLFGGRHE